ncbi:hypothetical protein THICB2_230042 [Thiomonas sp. CB2]|nr:hypothetical protein THICB2_230042 [Thiomonas sp. CB2]
MGSMRDSSWEPASVSTTLLVVRFSNRTPKRSSKLRIVWLRLDAVTLRSSAAFRKLRSRAMAAKQASSLKSACMD